MKYRIIILLMSCSMALGAKAQHLDDIQTPKVVPPSPDAAALGKYGEIPVDKSTGVPQISIPLYEIKTPRFTLPISLSYHASGIKVEEIASWVGAGWVLNAGGVITRSVVGFPDDGGLGILPNHANLKHAANIQWPADVTYISEAVNKQFDTEPDNFFYNFNGHAGAFVFGDSATPVLIPYEPIQVGLNLTSDNFSIVDEQGNMYSFSTKEGVASSMANMTCVSSWYLTQMVSADLSDTVKFLYKADSISQFETSYNFAQSMTNCGTNNTYSLKPMSTTTSTRQFNCLRVSSILFKGGKVDFIAKGGRLDEGVMSLDSVIVSNFNPVTSQYSRLKSFKLLTDYFYSTYPLPANFLSVGEPDKHRLKLIGLVENDGNNVPVKTHSFDYNPEMLPQVHSYAQDQWGYFNNKIYNQTLLQSQPIVIQNYSLPPYVDTIGKGQGADRSTSPTDMQAGVLQKITYPTKGYTVFAYECNKQEGVDLDSVTTISSGIGLHQENDTIIFSPTNAMYASGANIYHIRLSRGNDNPSYPLPYVQVVRVSDGAVIYTLTASATNYIDTVLPVLIPIDPNPLDPPIPFELIAVAHGGSSPTGPLLPYAIISTSYQAPSGSNLINVGGLRVTSISNYKADGTLAGKETYKYGNNDASGGGVLLAFSMLHHFSQGEACAIDIGNTRGTIDTYSNNSVYPMASLSGCPVGYPSVTVYHGDSLQNTGKSVYQYSLYADSPMVCTSQYFNGVRPIPVSWKNGEAVSEAHYRNNGDNQYALVESISNSFTNIGRQGATGTIIQFNPEPLYAAPNDECTLFITPVVDANGNVSTDGGTCPWHAYWLAWFDYPISTGSRVLAQKAITHFAPDGTSLGEITKYYYGNLNHVFPTRIVTYMSTGDSTVKTINYPQDMVIAGQDPTGIYSQMVTKNILSPDIQTTETKNGSLPLYVKTNNYYLTSSSNVALQSVVLQTSTNPSETRLTYTGYDRNNNVLSVSKANDLSNCYIWGYQSAMPIAQVVNADTSSIAYCSFEDGGTGKWNAFTGTVTTATTSPFPPTGNSYYNLTSTATLNKSGLVSGNVYTISYWSSNGVYSITGGTAVGAYVTGKTINGWTYYEHKIQASSATLTITGTGAIDEVRLYPANAQMTTYTYAPLVGLTSQCDVNNRISYYYYDGLQRLRYIKDQDGNILKTMEYHYQAQ